MSTLKGLFVSSTGTSEGKTLVSCALVSALRKSGVRIAAVKPIETGCAPHAADAMALADASEAPGLAETPGWYRAELPASPYAVELEAAVPPPSIEGLCRSVGEIVVAQGYEGVLVEGAGGLFVPLSRTTLIADLAQALELPIVLVALNQLGVLSHVLAVMEAARRRGLRIAAVVLNHGPSVSEDESVRTNRAILAERLDCPVVEFPSVALGPGADLAGAASSSGLLRIALSELDNV